MSKRIYTKDFGEDFVSIKKGTKYYYLYLKRISGRLEGHLKAPRNPELDKLFNTKDFKAFKEPFFDAVIEYQKNLNDKEA